MSANRLFLTVLLLVGACVLVAGCGSDPVAPVEDEAPVLPPENVTANVSYTDKLVITWDPNSHPQLRGYNVYRVETATQTMVKLTLVPIVETHYQDMSARRGIEYEYRVTATTKAGKESAYQAAVVMLEADPQEGPGSDQSRNTSE
jgi:fibronectin type 3 domain-containing protein